MSSRNVKFMPNVTKPNDGKETLQEDPDTSNLTPKQKRRAQVRKAQIEHRQRKQNYIKHLEQDVIDLREMIAAAETESVLFKSENEAIKTTLARSNVPISLKPLPQPPTTQAGDNTFPSNDYQPGPQSDFTASPEQDMNWTSQNLNSSPETSVVSINFDEYIDAMCLQISPIDTPNFNNTAGIPAPDSFDFNFLPPTNTQTPPSAPISSSKTIPPPTAAAPAVDASTLAINFILALEHPCRTHFHTPSSTFDPKGKPSGHELMASTLIYASAPPTIFTSPAFAASTPVPPPVFPNPPSSNPAPPPEPLSWTAPTLELQTLLEMSHSLPKSDWEITPVQAWFKLVDVVGVERLVGDGKVIEELKTRLGKLVGCWHFGAVVSEPLFWEEVWSVLDGGVGGGAAE